jgi:uncharacterized protein (DUF362 family)
MTKVWVWRSEEVGRAGWLSIPGGPWDNAVLKPNWVRHYNEHAPSDVSRLAETVTSPALLGVIAEALATRAQRVLVADAPQFDADWNELWRRLDLDHLFAQVRARGPSGFEIRDLRQEVVHTDENGVILSRTRRDADPEGYRVVDLGSRSAFGSSGFDFTRIRGADYDEQETIRHHSEGRHEYCVAGTILGADLVVNVPKMKTHKKSGVTLCLKNLVGINGNKNYLPHHRAGPPESGGDEFPGSGAGLYQRLRAWAVDHARPLLKQGLFTSAFRALRTVDVNTRPAQLVRNGNWSGNDTIWRTILDLNRILVYADREGTLRDRPQRQTFHVMDGIVAGEGDGPMAPDRRDLGLVICSADPVAADVAASALMGFDPLRIPVIRQALVPHELPITALGPTCEGLEIQFEGRTLESWQQLPSYRLRPHPGWVGTLERTDASYGESSLQYRAHG